MAEFIKAFWNMVVVGGVLITAITAIPVFIQMRNHPKGLHILFFAEMWERFSYYGMRGLLIFYLTQHFLFSDEFAGSQYGAYTSLVYLLPLIGGFLADKYLGTAKAISFGALLLVAGQLMMAVEGKPAVQVLETHGQRIEFQADGRGNDRHVYLPIAGQMCELNPPEGAQSACSIHPDKTGTLTFTGLPADASIPSVIPASEYKLGVEKRSPVLLGIFYLALSLIIMGVGFLKANISSIVGDLYEQDDPRRAPGFTLYYFGINLGAFWSSVLCGALGMNFGWAWGFGAAGVGMALGWIVFIRRRMLFFIPGEPQLPEDVGAPPDPKLLAEKVWGGLSREWAIYIGGLLGVIAVWFLVQSPPPVILHALNNFSTATLSWLGVGENAHPHMIWLLLAGSIAVLWYIIRVMVTECTKVERERMILALIFVAAATVFWTFFEQAGSSLNLFASRNTVLPNNGFWTMNAPQTQSLNAGFILIFAPIISALWAYLGRHGKDLNPTLKFGLGLIQLGIGFYVLVWGSQFANADFRVPFIFLVLLYMFHTTGELFLSPVGLSQITRLSVARVVSTMMAVWFLSSSWAQLIGGFIAANAGTETVAGAALDPEGAMHNSIHVFKQLGLIAVVLGVIMSIASHWLKRWEHDHEDREGHHLPKDPHELTSDEMKTEHE